MTCISSLLQVLVEESLLNFRVGFYSITVSSKNRELIYKHSVMDEWEDTFGFVIALSTNTWQTIIECPNNRQIVPWEDLS